MTSEANFILFYILFFYSFLFYILFCFIFLLVCLPCLLSRVRIETFYQSFDTACRRAMYLPRISNSMLTTVPTSMLQKLVWS